LLEIVDADEHGAEIEHRTTRGLGVGIPAHSPSLRTTRPDTNVRCPPRRSDRDTDRSCSGPRRSPDSVESHPRTRAGGSDGARADVRLRVTRRG
jgi:hypothetical protein